MSPRGTPRHHMHIWPHTADGGFRFGSTPASEESGHRLAPDAAFGTAVVYTSAAGNSAGFRTRGPAAGCTSQHHIAGMHHANNPRISSRLERAGPRRFPRAFLRRAQLNLQPSAPRSPPHHRATNKLCEGVARTRNLVA